MKPIRFYHQSQIVEVDDAHPTHTVLEWLRQDARCSGTKEGCNEGDCGACTVVIGELPSASASGSAVRGLELKTVNACIQFLPTLHGKALFTVEDLKAQASRCAKAAPLQTSAGETACSALHPTQQAMVDCHGSQCGFCTPGFVMSLWSSYEHHQAAGTRPSRQQLADELSGNLCRCTGYRPILDAGQKMFDLPAMSLDTQPVIDALTAIRADESGLTDFDYAAPASGSVTRDTFHAPRTVGALAELRERLPGAQLLAGSTDVGLWVNKQFRELGDIIYVGDVEELKIVKETDGELYIGAGATLEAAWSALAARFEGLTDVWLRFASPPIRNAGTMGGNVANGSPIGDSPPVLMALDAQIELRKGAVVRRMPLPEYYLDYMKNQLQAGEFVAGLIVPMSVQSRRIRAYKISKRFDCDISALCAGLSIELDGDLVKTVRVAFGGMAATVRRGARTEAAITGQPWTQATVKAAQAALAEDFKPLSDMRASAAYRLQVAQNLLQRFWLETRTVAPLASSSTSVWSIMPHVVASGVQA